MKRGLLPISLLAACVLLSVGCSDSGDSPPTAEQARSESISEQAGAPGVLIGRILFEGAVPPARKIQVNKDVNECKQAAGVVQDVVVSGNGGLADAVVEVLGMRNKGDRVWPDPKDGYVIHQKDCRFSPHLLVTPIGAELVIYNDDPVTHNINTGHWNEAQGPGADPLKKKIRGRGFVRVNCNIHSWMESWVYVAQSPYYAVTGSSGEFRIEGLPPGSYRVTANYPTLGNERFQIKIGSGQTVEKDVTFRSPQRRTS
ncbi:MAG: carboxypeptidase regulatory-like domain-containing protein [Acidobacteriota bacterium]